MQSGLVELTLDILRRGDREILVADADPADAVWLPLAQVEVIGVAGRFAVVAVPARLARQKGLI